MGEGKANVGHGGGLAHASLARGDEGDARGGARELGLVVPLEEGQMGIWVL